MAHDSRLDWLPVQLAATTAPQPCPRSAHVICNRYPRSVCTPRALLLHGGEGQAPSERQAAPRSNDTWLLNLDDLAAGAGCWERLECTSVYGEEDVPTARSNHAAVMHEHILYVFGGWSADGLEPLANLELLHLQSKVWTSAATLGSPPRPRGNPTMVLYPLRTDDSPVTSPSGAASERLVIFGGWDGKRRMNDLHVLDLASWRWEQPASMCDLAAGKRAGEAQREYRDEGEEPPPMTDHSAVVWDRSGTANSVMVVFGGMHDAHVGNQDGRPCPVGAGATADVWLLELGPTSSSSSSLAAAWRRLDCCGDIPTPRTSHTAQCVGDFMVVAGGQVGNLLTASCHILNLATGLWRRVGDLALPLCRHSSVFADGCIMSFGGYDGAKCHNRFDKLPLGELAGLATSSVCTDRNDHKSAASDPSLHTGTARDATTSSADATVLERKLPIPNGNRNSPDLRVPSCSSRPISGTRSARPVKNGIAAEDIWRVKAAPLTLGDLEPATVDGLSDKGRIRALHKRAVELGLDTYIDPASGYSCFTKLFLERRPCCGNKCRHCPHGHANVPGVKARRESHREESGQSAAASPKAGAGDGRDLSSMSGSTRGSRFLNLFDW